MRTSETAGSGKPSRSTHISTNIEKIEAKIWTSLFPLFSFDQQHCCVCSTTKTAMQSTTLSSATYGIHQKRKWGKMKDFWPRSIRPLWPHFELTCFLQSTYYKTCTNFTNYLQWLYSLIFTFQGLLRAEELFDFTSKLARLFMYHVGSSNCREICLSLNLYLYYDSSLAFSALLF